MSIPHHLVQESDLHVAILAGGPSQERAVSLNTGAAIEHALIRLGYRVDMIDPGDDFTSKLLEVSPDIVFNALHGTYGEDGVVQGILEWMKIPYTGSKLLASALAMDKSLSRRIFTQANLPVAQAFTWAMGTPLPNQQLLPDAPWIVKPTNEGSSVGLDLCMSYDELMRVLSQKTPDGPSDWLIEEYVAGIEVSVVIFEHEVWGSVEVVPSSKLYDYEAKYERGDTQYFCPPRIHPEVTKRLEDYAARAYRSLGCAGICRADFITSDARDIILELNTLPGMTETSLVPKVAAARGIEFEVLVQRLIEVELNRGASS